LSSDLDIQRAVDDGKRNLEAKELIQNWCGHARVEKFGGTGLIEMETGLPIGPHSMVCDHAPAGGVATWLLEESAIHFHDSHCVGCSKRLSASNFLKFCSITFCMAGIAAPWVA
jgi:hypothetical protein